MKDKTLAIVSWTALAISIIALVVAFKKPTARIHRLQRPQMAEMMQRQHQPPRQEPERQREPKQKKQEK